MFISTGARQVGKTVLFLDEIQSCPNARVALKSFAIDKRIDVVASGALLGLYYKDITSYLVEYEKIVDMYHLDFEEFLWAIEVKSGNNKQSKSLTSIVNNYKTVSRYIKMEKDTNVYVDNLGIEHYPLFMIMFI